MLTTLTPGPDSWPPFEGASSFQTVSQQVIDELEKDSPILGQEALQSEASASGNDKFRPRQSLDPSHAPLLPSAKVLRILEAAGSVVRHSSRACDVSDYQGAPEVLEEFPFIDLEELSSLCQKLYFPVKGFSIGDFITVQSCIFFLTRDLVKVLVEQLDFNPLEIQQVLSQCSSSLTQILNKLPLLIQPVFENIRALLLLVSRHSDWATTLLTTITDICAPGDRSICYSINTHLDRVQVVFGCRIPSTVKC